MERLHQRQEGLFQPFLRFYRDMEKVIEIEEIMLTVSTLLEILLLTAGAQQFCTYRWVSTLLEILQIDILVDASYRTMLLVSTLLEILPLV